MRQITSLITIIFIGITTLNAQNIKVAILDFENTSGIAKYNGLGKAMSSMLITDIEANVSPKRLQLVERSQIQKVLKEQNFQATSAVDKTSSVKAGKLLGVKYLLVGDIYILNDVLVINARLTDTETADIKFSKKQEGKLVGWLNLKTNIAKELAASIAMPFTEPNIPDKEMNMATITSFGNAITAKDEGKIEKAEEIVNTIQEFSPDFKYLDDLKSQLDELKKQVEKNTADIKVLEKSGGRIINSSTPKEIMNNMTSLNAPYKDRKIELEKLLTFPLDSIQYLYGKTLSLATFGSYPASTDGYTQTCIDLDYFIDDLQYLLKLKEKSNKASLVFFIQTKLDYFSGDISRTFPQFIFGDYTPPIYSQQFKPLIENCNKDKVVIVNKLISEAKLFIVSKK